MESLSYSGRIEWYAEESCIQASNVSAVSSSSEINGGFWWKGLDGIFAAMASTILQTGLEPSARALKKRLLPNRRAA